MRILAIDTATVACSVALWNNGTINAHFELCPREHSQRIQPMVQEILAARGVSLIVIDAL
ncbi:tRNA threonylcarbamoyladenosine biosynthesis protein TsaB, partial [Salmonella enterica subsp. enterica]|uniref:tRNA threonylcarbamoyladenosine biosynthesis protein TsaB n=1 Tax=Salmonella enterica TaxID=28901 RepID=UPI003D32B992